MCNDALLLPRNRIRTRNVKTRDKRSIPGGTDDDDDDDDARLDNNDDVMMNDLSACNAIEKFAVFETGPSGFRPQLPAAYTAPEVFQLHDKTVASFPQQQDGPSP